MSFSYQHLILGRPEHFLVSPQEMSLPVQICTQLSLHPRQQEKAQFSGTYQAFCLCDHCPMLPSPQGPEIRPGSVAQRFNDYAVS